MPSPFPGMDPYLEGSEWTSIHTELSSEIARQLAPKLRPKYIVRATRRFFTDMPEDVGISTGDFFPDTSVFASAGRAAIPEAVVLVPNAPLQMATVMPVQVPHITIEIHDVANRVLVTAIEVLSPTNKRGEGYREYLVKRSHLLQSTAHLVEIDLLRKGKRVPMQKPLPAAPYFVFVSRAGQRPMVQIWPIQLNMSLPIVPIPLLPGDADSQLDLQLALSTIYDALNYDLAIDYTRPPEVALKQEEAIWVLRHLQATGMAVHPTAWRQGQNGVGH